MVSRTGAAMVPFGFEDEMMEAVARGEVNAGAVSPRLRGLLQHCATPTQPLKVVRAQDSEPELRWTVAVGLAPRRRRPDRRGQRRA